MDEKKETGTNTSDAKIERVSLEEIKKAQEEGSKPKVEKKEKIKYTPPKNFEKRKQNILNAFQKQFGSIPDGFDNDLFMSAVVRILNHLEENYPTTIKKDQIPDSDKFVNPAREEYTITQFVLNRLAKNVGSVKFIDKNPDSNSTRMGGYTSIVKKGSFEHAKIGYIQIYMDKLNENVERQKTSTTLSQFESEEDYRKMMIEEAIVHETIHAISDNEKSFGFRMDMDAGEKLNEGMTENLACEIVGLRDYSKTRIKKRLCYKCCERSNC